MKSIRFLILGLFLGTTLRAADVTIAALPAAGTIVGTEVLPVVQAGTTKKATVAGLVTGLPAASGSVAGTMSATDKTKLDAATNSGTASTIVLRDGSGNFTANVITTNQVTVTNSPTNPTDAANKAYVDAAAAGLVIKTPAVASTVSANVTLAGGAPATLDGVSLVHLDRVLVKNQTDDKQNGIYFVATLGTGANGTWTRTTDADTGAKLVTGSYVFITGGTVNANAAFTMVTPGTITIGTSSIVWNLFSQVTQIQAANVIGQLVGSQIQNAAITTAKFASGLTPVEVLGSLPGSANFQGRTVFLTSDNQLYRYTGSAWTAAVPTTGLSGQITTTQITDTAVTAAKMAANSVTAGTVAANAITAGTIATGAVTAGTIAAGAVNTTELAAGAVNASKIAAATITASQIAANTITASQIATGTITADRLNVSSLSSITANIGTITSGSLTSSAAISVGSGTTAVHISGSTFTVGLLTVTDYASIGTQLSLINSSPNHQATMYSSSTGAAVLAQNSGTGKQAIMFDTGLIRTNEHVETPLIGNAGLGGPRTPQLYDGTHTISFYYGNTPDAIVGTVDATDFVLQRAGAYTGGSPTADGWVTMKDGNGVTRRFLVQTP